MEFAGEEMSRTCTNGLKICKEINRGFYWKEREKKRLQKGEARRDEFVDENASRGQ